jgi:signal transduction histidine kinase
LKKVVINLLTSAVKFTSEGGRIGVKIEKVNGGAFKLEITDTGTGMLADDIPKLTQPFFKSGDSERLANGSLGLGLVITLELVEIHEGVLSVQS